MTTLQQLTEDEIESMPAGDDLDWLVFRYVICPDEYRNEMLWDRRRNYNNDWRGYSTNITLAWQVAERLRLFIIPFGKTEWACTNKRSNIGFENIVVAYTAPLAICRVAIRTVRDSQF